jgi:hypothetical protein
VPRSRMDYGYSDTWDTIGMQCMWLCTMKKNLSVPFHIWRLLYARSNEKMGARDTGVLHFCIEKLSLFNVLMIVLDNLMSLWTRHKLLFYRYKEKPKRKSGTKYSGSCGTCFLLQIPHSLLDPPWTLW